MSSTSAPSPSPRSRAGRAVDSQCSPEGLHTRAQAGNAGAGALLRSPDPVVGNNDVQPVVGCEDLQADDRRVRVLLRVGERLGHDEVRRRLDGHVDAGVWQLDQVDRGRRHGSERSRSS